MRSFRMWFRLICKSSVVICDLTGKNANVFYEAELRTPG